MAPGKRQSSAAAGSKPSEVMKETLRIVERGLYRTEGGAQVKLNAKRLRAAASCALKYEEVPLQPLPAAAAPSCVRLVHAGSLQAAAALGEGTLVLDFASDTNAGGGCRKDQQGTQEESLCRQSSLLPSLEKQQYPIPRMGCIYAPDVCVFRGEEWQGYPLLAEPFWISVVAAALPNCGGKLDGKQRAFVADKIRSVLNLALIHGHKRLVLGAWGCGAFDNDSADVAEVFRTELQRVRSLDVVFAIKGKNIEPFSQVFGMEALTLEALAAEPEQAMSGQVREKLEEIKDVEKVEEVEKGHVDKAENVEKVETVEKMDKEEKDENEENEEKEETKGRRKKKEKP